MARSNHESSMFSGLVIARSVDVPSPPDAISYTIQVEHEDGVVEFENMVTQDYYRDYGVEVDLVPFPVGHRVPIEVSRLGAVETYSIATGERIHVGECP